MFRGLQYLLRISVRIWFYSVAGKRFGAETSTNLGNNKDTRETDEQAYCEDFSQPLVISMWAIFYGQGRVSHLHKNNQRVRKRLITLELVFRPVKAPLHAQYKLKHIFFISSPEL